MAQLGYWRRRSREIIDLAISEYYRLNSLPPQHRPNDEQKKQIERRLCRAYPFADKSGFAYQCWLKERKIALSALYGRPLRQPKNKNITPDGQLTLELGKEIG